MSGDGVDGLDKDGNVIYSNPDEDPANAPGLDHLGNLGDAILGELRGIREAILTLAVLYGAHNKLSTPGEVALFAPSPGQGYVSMALAMSEATGFLDRMEVELAKAEPDGA